MWVSLINAGVVRWGVFVQCGYCLMEVLFNVGEFIYIGDQHSRQNSISGSAGSNEDIWLRPPRTTSTSSSASCTLRETVYTRVWKVMLNLSVDPYSQVASMAKKVVNNVTVKVSNVYCLRHDNIANVVAFGRFLHMGHQTSYSL